MEKKWGERLAPWVAVLAILGAGFTVAHERTELWKDKAEEYEKKLNKSEEQLKESEKELYAAQKATPFPETDSSLKKITVIRGGTGEITGELLISVPAIEAAYKPFRYVVTAKVSGPGSQGAVSKELTIGDGFDFGSYRVRLLSADFAKAQFGLQKL